MPPPSLELLPELISDILLRLPAKSLLRFRCLSNSHRDEIDSSNFAQIHLKRSIETRSHRKLILTDQKDFYVADFDDGLKTSIKFNNQLPDQEQYSTEILTNCHGLILLRVNRKWEWKQKLFLWNPSTRRFKELPSCPAQGGFCCGLGYDSASGDYKVIITDKNRGREPKHVWVFSLKSNCWRWTQELHLDAVMCDSIGFANGFLYWILLEDDRKMVGCFDLASEVFFTMPSFCSPNDGGLLDGDVGVGVLEGNAYMDRNNWKANTIEFYSPVVGGEEDRGGLLPGGKWSKIFTFQCQMTDAFHLYGTPLAYSKDGAYVLLETGREIFWYNMKMNTRHRLEQLLNGISAPKYDLIECCVIWESLVSFGNDGVLQV